MDASGAGYPFEYLIETLDDSSHKKFFNVPKLGGTKYDILPYSVRVLLEAAIRKCDGFFVKKEDVMNILDWKTKQSNVEVPLFPARVLLQDFTGIPAMVDFAAMREAVKTLGGDPEKVHPACPTDLTVDHSLQIDFSKCAIQNAPNPGGGELQKAGKLSPLRAQPKKPCRGQATCRGSCDSAEPSQNSGTFAAQIENTPVLCPFHLQPVPEPETVLKNQEVEFGRNRERLQFFKWSSRVFNNVAVVPPGTGTAHQVNLEYLSRVVCAEKDLLFPDSVVGTDSHITMVNGLGILGWGVGGIETEAVMLGLPVSLTLPEVVGCELTGSSNPLATSIDVVLGITKHLRQVGVAGKFVEFFGSGVSQLSIVDRTTIANMCPEYGAILSFFPVDNVTLKHLEHTGFDKTKLKSVEMYLKAVKLFRNDQNSSEPEYSQVIQINLSSIIPSVSGPKRPQDRVAVTDMKNDFQACLSEKVGFKGFQIAAEKQSDTISIHYEGREYQLTHGSVVIAAVISCTNNCNPSVMLAAGLLAKKAVEAGLCVKPYIRTSLSPGSGMVTHYLSSSGVLPYLSKLVGNKWWDSLEAPDSVLFPWDLKSTYIRCPSFFDKLTKEPVALQPIENAHVLLHLGDSITTDHISPAGSIARSSAAAKYLTNRGLTPREFNSYGARRGNDAVMTRGTFANIKLFNKFIGKPAPKTIHFPSGQTLDVFEAAEMYQKEGIPLIILAGKKYGSGNSRDWAAKGPYLLGVKAVLAESYEKIHKDHLIEIGIAPLQFLPGESADVLGLSGRETFSLTFPEELSPGITVNIKTSTGKVFSVIASFENDVEITLYKHGGLLNFVARKFS
uniref:Iron regulatory protein 2 n=1 Tax=Cavia porcellus TaxID=10141 RepID=H0VPU0_CAVPO